MKIYTAKKYIVMWLVNKIYAGTHHFEEKRKLLNSIGYEIGIGSKIVGPIHNTGKLIVGEDSWVGANLTIHGNGIVTIGSNCDIAPDVTFLTGGHEIGSFNRRAGRGTSYSITVKSGVWIGARAAVLGNICIGEASIVAACACVNNDVDSNTLVGGVPAKTIRRLADESEDIYKK